MKHKLLYYKREEKILWKIFLEKIKLFLKKYKVELIFLIISYFLLNKYNFLNYNNLKDTRYPYNQYTPLLSLLIIYIAGALTSKLINNSRITKIKFLIHNLLIVAFLILFFSNILTSIEYIKEIYKFVAEHDVIAMIFFYIGYLNFSKQYKRKYIPYIFIVLYFIAVKFMNPFSVRGYFILLDPYKRDYNILRLLFLYIFGIIISSEYIIHKFKNKQIYSFNVLSLLFTQFKAIFIYVILVHLMLIGGRDYIPPLKINYYTIYLNSLAYKKPIYEVMCSLMLMAGASLHLIFKRK